ncbi:MAG: alpha/beta hydrolase, partial [Betaproteobacteria bacterium]|nr:alpha/beta hydrolase [Betaproteobacteria bacterium]
IAACRWLTEDELAVYSAEFGRTGLQGGLQWYRARVEPPLPRLFQLFAGRKIEVPACFIAGKSDWGVYQRPGSLEDMRDKGCARFQGVRLVEGAGHWVQQEQPEAVVRVLLEFFARRG